LLLGASIDEARGATRTVRESEERMAFAAASGDLGLWQYYARSGEFWMTEHCRAMLGFSESVALTRDALLDVVHPEDRSIAAEALGNSFEHQDIRNFDFRIVLPDGEMRWISGNCRAERDETGRAAELTGIIRDSTERIASQQQAELQRRELAHLTRVAVMGELSGAIAHELNQPLTAILANAQAARKMLAQQTPNLAEIAEALNDIVQDDSRAGDVISRLRSLMKKGTGRIDTISLNTLVESTVQLLHSELVSRHVRVTADLRHDLPRVTGDSVELQQVIINLMMNAMEAMSSTAGPQRLVRVKTRSNGHETVEVSIEDRGGGIGATDEARLFEPFFTTKDHGLGLGLSICSNIIRSHRGELDIVNNAHGGATATFTLPRQPDA
jgi:PAS domain S-box-containing protein